MENGDVFVSSVSGALVTRMPTLRTGRPAWIGASRVEGKLVWDEKEIVRIPADEFASYRKTYQRALDNGELKQRTEAEYEAHHKEREAKADADAKKAKAEAEKKAKEAAKAAKAEAPTKES